MSKRILKYQLDPTGTKAIPLPAHYEVLSVAFQGESLCVWIAQSQHAGRDVVELTLTAVETGMFAPPGMAHLATAHGFWRGSPFTAHVYQRKTDLP